MENLAERFQKLLPHVEREVATWTAQRKKAFVVLFRSADPKTEGDTMRVILLGEMTDRAKRPNSHGDFIGLMVIAGLIDNANATASMKETAAKIIESSLE